MLPQFYLFVAVNNTGQTLTYDGSPGGRLNLKLTGYKWNSTNSEFDYTVLSDDDFGFGAGDSTADAAEDQSSEKDNTSDKYDGLQLQLELTHDEGAAADGTYDLYIDGGDATGELATDATGYDDAEKNRLELVGQLTWHSDGTDDQVMRSPVWEV